MAWRCRDLHPQGALLGYEVLYSIFQLKNYRQQTEIGGLVWFRVSRLMVLILLNYFDCLFDYSFSLINVLKYNHSRQQKSISINLYVICCLCCADSDDFIVVCYPMSIHHVIQVKFRDTTQRLSIITGVQLDPP